MVVVETQEDTKRITSSLSKRWAETPERPELTVVYRRGGTDKQKDCYERNPSETTVRRRPVCGMEGSR